MTHKIEIPGKYLTDIENLQTDIANTGEYPELERYLPALEHIVNELYKLEKNLAIQKFPELATVLT